MTLSDSVFTSYVAHECFYYSCLLPMQHFFLKFGFWIKLGLHGHCFHVISHPTGPALNCSTSIFIYLCTKAFDTHESTKSNLLINDSRSFCAFSVISPFTLFCFSDRQFRGRRHHFPRDVPGRRAMPRLSNFETRNLTLAFHLS